ncbi:hypothetical protein [Sphingomonas sp. CFBP 8760]|uniref:hypothetical protein n=1 Tax=Sphingomonas sp. CFBP 8760 TaxID=2775282 RepID=UPI00177ED6E8|nr:hypothetical protein [Sphingomonas sp. CFBP 8760]MBD8547748.1 hypothetical protein [Sphingomonas sp. CFBP 8760]
MIGSSPIPGPPRRAALDERICRLICPIASAMVGVCLTGIGLLHVGVAIGRRASIADDLLAIDSLLFLVATLASYVSLRSLHRHRLHRMERVADATFMIAMLLLTAACFVITYALSA